MFGVGVGGLTLGSGISWLSNLHGMTCDNVLDYEVVLGNGSIVTASPNSHPDLYWALRGGESNFGIVTKFTFDAYEQGKLWTAQLEYDGAANASSITAFDYNKDALPTGTAILTHADTFTNSKHPAVFDGFYSAGPNNITETNAYHAEIADGLVFPGGVTRNSFWTTSFALDAEMMQTAFEIWREEAKAIKDIATRHFAEQERPLGFLNIIAMWRNAEDDKIVYATQQRIEDRLNAAARERGLHNGFKYTNYASQFQDPFTSYGAENKARLMKIAEGYDPDGVFQNLVSGGFKLTRGPEHV
ncbi:Bifunctional solanapyrone synthase [Colletotrichum aenigma]|uniref:Bifunctional solanapyrone synthase n=1 Tax=Colletotrichum aenigma TaxID=1215731 RepID=UPI001872B410|nr:Bifunctional solanapyrone synthase [Colletotrichum aenigma]KAF5525967.1 Bifunctional solanapyrone synthase [Colletotrichum aenigma]